MIRLEDVTVKTAFDLMTGNHAVVASVCLQSTGRVSAPAGSVDKIVQLVGEELRRDVLRLIYGDVHDRLVQLQADCREVFDAKVTAQNRRNQRECVMTLIQDTMDAIGVDPQP